MLLSCLLSVAFLIIVFVLAHLSCTFTGQLFTGVSFEIGRGDVLGIVGGNGAGKSTFLRCVVGDIDPDDGSSEIGDTVHLGVVSQSRADLDPKRTVGPACAPAVCFHRVEIRREDHGVALFALR